MIFYLVVFSVILLLGFIPIKSNYSKQSRKLYLVIAFSIMALIVGLRADNVGEDTTLYMRMFNSVQYLKWGDIFSNFFTRTNYAQGLYGYQESVESGFLIICKFFHFFSDNGHFFLLFIASITYFLFGKFIYDNTEDVVAATIIVLCESIFMASFNGVRQLLSVAIAIQAYTCLKRKNYKLFIVYILLAFLVHNTSIIALLLIPIFLVKKENEKKLFKYFSVFSILLPTFINIFSGIIVKLFPRYVLYFQTNYWSNSIGGAIILLLLEIIIIFFLWKKGFKTQDSFQLSTLIMIFISLEFTGYKITMFSRAALFYRAFLPLFFPCAINSFKGNNKRLIAFAVYVLLIGLFISYAKSPARIYDVFF